MSSFKKSFKGGRAEHKERSQPAGRKKLGLLEKGKDWKLRRDDFHSKEKRLTALYEKARNKNPDEFYFGMVNAKTKDGRHVLTREGVEYTADEMKLLRTQDSAYINLRCQQERQKIEKLRADLHLMIPPDEEAGPAIPSEMRNKHVVFVDSAKQVAEFDPVAHFDTAPELINRAFNRPKLETLKTSKVQAPDSEAEMNALDRKRLAGYTELEQRIVRLAQLAKLGAEMQSQRDMQGKGRKKKVKGAEGQPVTYKWRKERKR